MGAEPPFLYVSTHVILRDSSIDRKMFKDHPSKYTFLSPTDRGFNPKAATQASWSPPRPKPKIEGPLINSKEFNKHPDSYFVVPYGNIDSKPMSLRTKSKVKWIRHTQLVLRICELLAATGMLFCVICIKKTDSTTGWIIRIPSGIAIIHTLYAIYHLARSSKGRTPSSSASYMIFAAIIDIGLIPFLVFTALISHTEYIEPVNVTGHWTTLFGSDEATTKITESTFLISVVSGSLHLLSLIISIYLGVIFRKISRLPPDMNPLEDNLTSRHKRNKSSLLDNRMGQVTTATANSKRDSKVNDPLISPPRTVPFMHTRTESRENVTNMHSPVASARASRIDLSATPFYDQPPAHRSSQTNIKGPFYTQAASQRSSITRIQNPLDDQTSPGRTYCTDLHPISLDEPPKPDITTTNLHRSPTKSSSIYSTNTISTIKTDRPPSTRPRSTAPSLPDSNWITHPSPSPSPSPSPPRELRHLRNKKSSYQPLSQTSPFEYAPNNENLLPKPLEMNPPTPPIPLGEQQQQQQRHQAMSQRALTPSSGNAGQGNWGSGSGMMGIGKARAWGGMGRSGPSSMGGGGGRVVSRSGVEVRPGGILPSGGIRAREVSGKVMEEGRGGAGSWM
ncbi:hypothetical protein ACLMJK_001806 [Lecanora helva]